MDLKKYNKKKTLETTFIRLVSNLLLCKVYLVLFTFFPFFAPTFFYMMGKQRFLPLYYLVAYMFVCLFACFATPQGYTEPL